MTAIATEVTEFPFAPYRSLSNEEFKSRIAAVRRAMGSKLLILGHHYQQDEVIEHADLAGDVSTEQDGGG